nr:D-glycero-beta-D-manno-heptose 1,7-bisphosphate 7-phosphatase [Aquabacterium fontiphilum]
MDRDGVINVDHAYVHRWEDFAFVPGAIEAMRALQDAGYALVVVTNQSGIARGMYTEDDFARLTEQMRQHLQQAGVTLTAVYHCPHHPNGTVPAYAVACDCRKPEPGMILRAAREHGLSLAASLMVGDKPADMLAARAAGVGRAYLVQSDNEESVAACDEADAIFDNLSVCVSQVLAGA